MIYLTKAGSKMWDQASPFAEFRQLSSQAARRPFEIGSGEAVGDADDSDPCAIMPLMKNLRMVLALGVVSVALASHPAAAAAKRGMVPDDIMRIKVISALEVAPDGSRVVYGVETSDRKKKGYMHALFEIGPEGGEPKPLTDPKDDCSTPRFSPDGRSLAYLCTLGDGKEEDASAQVYIAKTGSRKGEKSSRFAEGVEDYAWSPDGKSLVVVRKDPAKARAVPPGQKDSEKKDKDQDDDDPDPIVVTRT